ncbi:MULTISPECIES: DUF1493 family protein [Yersinia]|uniref:DUF1493 family protein n=1 Tax=Yersinia TaxID=629 RepID=UPI0020A2096B|nr:MULTISPECIES: DUF1493 family protein [Yersinia]
MVTTITFKKIPVEVDSVLQNNFGFEDISDATDAYFKAFNVTYDNFYWSNYFPLSLCELVSQPFSVHWGR